MSITDTILKSTDNVSSTFSGISNLANATGSYANKIKSLNNGKSSAMIRDINTNGFLSSDSIFKPQFFARAFDEPTYLTFRIEFINKPTDFSNALRNISYNNQGVIDNGDLGSPLYYQNLMYSTMYDYLPEPLLDGYTSSSLDADLGKRYSTEAYLDVNLGEHGRAALLHNFKIALDDIQQNFPFYFKSISGLGSLTKVDIKRGSRLKDAKITIDCLEGLDLKITQLLNMYRKIVWDDTYQRWVLPDMMRYFGMRIYVSEIRLFHDNIIDNKGIDNYNYDFSIVDNRNATTSSKDSKWNNILNTSNKVNELTNAFLGTKSAITQATQYAAAALTSTDDVINAIHSISNDISKCNNAINTVMPTICYECHMCEFDIEDSMSYLDSLQSSSIDSNNPSPKIVIKVGQVKESQTYPLNATLKYGNNGYYKNIADYNNKVSYNNDINSFTKISDMRNNELKFIGNYIYDEALNRKNKTPKLNNQLSQYTEDLSHIVGSTEAETLGEARFVNDNIINNLSKMSYNRNAMSKELSQMSLTTATLNELADVSKRLGVSSSITGTNSLATNQNDTIKSILESVGDMLNEAAARIYNDPTINSMATSEQYKVKIANKLFGEFIKNVDDSTATENTNLKAILKNYKIIIENQDSVKSATKRDKIEGFSKIN